jgi:hypothetical protein
MLQYNFAAELSEDETLERQMKNKNTPQSHSVQNIQPPINSKAPSKKAAKSTLPVAARIVQPMPEANWSGLRDPQVKKFLEELSRLEELLLKSARVPLTGKAMVAEDEIIEHLDFIRSRLPAALDAAQLIVQQQELILATAEQQAHQHITAAEQQAFQISNELGIVDRAKAEAAQIHQGVMAECVNAREQIRQEAEQAHRQRLQEVDAVRQQALAEAQEIRRGANEYADQVLQAIDGQLGEIQAKIRRGRQHINSTMS